ncbi:MAG: type II toxin-antitoxin system VapC family toxin [Actinobacteria bacterium]|nr:type II toxin-antitoxin system VapC family toxin [Actinomycetota bacterium]
MSGLVADTSALLAALFAGPQRDAVLIALVEADAVLLSSCCLLEATIVAQSRLGPAGQAELEQLLDAFGVEASAFTADQATVAVDAWGRFGKGRHPAALNLLDCCSYALARAARLPLLAIGHDFARTDIDLLELLGLR